MTTSATEKGQITIPNKIRKALRIQKGRRFHVELTSAGDILLRPLPSADSMYGIFKSRTPRDPNEKQIWREARGREILEGRKA